MHIEMNRLGYKGILNILTSILGGTVYVLLAYKGVEHALLIAEGATVSVPLSVLVVVLVGIVPFVFRRRNHRARSFQWVWEIVGYLFVLVLMLFIRTITNFNFVALEWHKAPQILKVMLMCAPGVFMVMLLYSASIIGLMRKFYNKQWIFLFFLVIWMPTVVIIFNYDVRNSRVNIFLYPHIMILAALYLVFIKRWLRITWEILLLFCFISYVSLIYCGALPIQNLDEIRNKSFIKMLDVPGERKSSVNYSFVRALQISEDGQTLFFTFGPTSGLIRFHIPDGRFIFYETHEALLRHFHLLTHEGKVVALEWIWNCLMVFDAATLDLLERENISSGKSFVSGNFSVDDDYYYVASSQLPGVRKIRRETTKTVKELFFEDIEYTRFKCGGWDIVMHPTLPFLYAEVDYIDARDDAAVLKLSKQDLTLVGSLLLPKGGDQIDLMFISEKDTVIASSFFGDRIYEIDAQTMELLRTIISVPNCRDIIFDARRELLYAASFISGTLYIVNYTSGNVLATTKLGKSLGSMIFDSDADAIYFASTSGLGCINVPEMLRALKIR